MSQININIYVANVSYSNGTPRRNFKLTEYTSLVDIINGIQYLLVYGDNQRIVKLKYHSPSIDNRGKIEFNNFEFKTDADVRAM